jgi:ketosteroid isomerase-like protein
VSQENAEFVLRVQPRLEVDLVRLFRDEDRWARFTRTAAPLYHSDFVSAGAVLGVEMTRAGLPGLREFWLDWLAPWATYRTEAQEAIDLGQRVLVLSRSFGRLEGSTHEVKEAPAAVWTVRDGKIARVEFYTSRDEARAGVRLADRPC